MIKIIIATLISIFYLSNLNAEESSSSTKVLARIIELTASQANTSNRGPETMSSLLGSTRMANSLTSNQNEVYNEIKKSNEFSAYTKLKYSHQFSDYFFVGISYMDSTPIQYNRTSIGSQSAYIYDSMKSVQNFKRANIGFGPLNYLDSFSFEISMGFESGIQKGPFNNYGFRQPQISNNRLQAGNLFIGNGYLDISYSSYSLLVGVSGLWNWFGIYFIIDMQFVNSSMSLKSIGYDTKDSKQKTNIPFTLSPNMQYSLLRFPSVFGLLFNYEAGFIFKIFENFGFKIGGQYQLAVLEYNKPKGYYFSNNTWSEATSSVGLSSAAKRKGLGFWNISFGIVTKF